MAALGDVSLFTDAGVIVTSRESLGRSVMTKGLSSRFVLVKLVFGVFIDRKILIARCVKIWSSSKRGKAGLWEMGDVDGEVMHVEADEASVTVDAHEFVREIVESDSASRERGPSKRNVVTEA